MKDIPIMLLPRSLLEKTRRRREAEQERETTSTEKGKEKERAMDEETIRDPNLVPEPLFSRPSAAHRNRRSGHGNERGLPVIVDAGVRYLDPKAAREDRVFWNSVLLEEGEYWEDTFRSRRSWGPRRAYWVSEDGRECGWADTTDKGECSKRGDGEKGSAQKGDPLEKDFAFKEGTDGRTPTRYAAIHSPQPLSADCVRLEQVETGAPRNDQHGSTMETSPYELDSQYESRPNMHDEQPGPLPPILSPRTMRGGGAVPERFNLNLNPNVLTSIITIAETDPMCFSNKPVPYSTNPVVMMAASKDAPVTDMETVALTPGEIPSVDDKVVELPTDSAENKVGKAANFSYPFPSMTQWDQFGRRRPSTASLEHAYDLPELKSNKDSSVGVNHNTTDGIGVALTCEDARNTDGQPVTEANPTFSNNQTEDQSEHSSGPHNPPVQNSENGKPPLPTTGVPISLTPDWPPTHQAPAPSPAGTPHFFRSFSSSLNSEQQEYLLSNLTDPPSSAQVFRSMEHTLHMQADSIKTLQQVVDELTERREYYEESLLPQTLHHWQSTNKENHALAVAVRSQEEENAMLWDLLEFSRKLLDLCWQRDQAVLNTAKTMHLRKINRISCALLERLVNSFGPGRGGGRSDGEKRRRDSPSRADMEQLVFVCEQNLRLFGEDLQYWNGNVGVVEGLRKGREGDGEADGQGEKRGQEQEHDDAQSKKQKQDEADEQRGWRDV